jgi:hypothetical protein
MDPKRRDVLHAAAGLFALALAPRVQARLRLLKETHPEAVAMNYVADAASLDTAAQPEFVAGSRCTGCYFFQGRSSDETAPCTVFAGWRVNAQGWCRGFAARGQRGS